MSTPPATLANWRTAPSNRWACHHVRELIPTADIPNDRRRARELASGSLDLSRLKIESDSGEPLTLEFIVVHRGEIVFERYANSGSSSTRSESTRSAR